jgi:formylglycine-generating enzyme required for sulfatase activity
LLRDLRRCLTDGGYDAGLEGEVWCHQHLDTSAIACAISPYAVKDWRKEFQQLSPALQQRTLQCLRDWHAQLPQAIHHEETLVWYHLTNSFDDAESMHINQARAFFQRLTNSLQQKNLAMVNLDARALQLQLADRHLQWVSPVLASKERYIIDLSVSVTEADTNRTDTVLEEGIDPVAWLMALPVLPSQKLKLIQQADSRLGLCVGFTPEAAALGVSPLTDLELDRSVILLAEGEHGLTGGYRTWFWQTAPQDKPLVLPPLLIGGDEFIKTTSVFSIYTGQQKLRFERLAMPSWASGMGQDNYGLYADLELQGIILRFRWINPGSFLMGSPEDEEGRSDYEDLHLVTLSQGFWLAETTVTQALWQVVMSKNRSVFKGDKRPVENVMWDEVLRFIDRLNQMFPEVHSRLPWEAEWEYACRAGSHTPFNFDGAVTLDRVNFRGSWDYEEGVWGKDALRETAEVKTYPCNAWGLYEMHGNVWEWCQDGWQRNLGKEAVCDPWQWQQPLVGFSARVVRGGSWGNCGRGVRSAYRSGNAPDDRNGDLGFRLALGHAEFQSGQGSGTSGPVATDEDAGRRVAEQRQTGSSSVADDVKK